ncbi:signal transduction histidine kinase [Pontibacter ummariensis]|uniref:histidine kinase n=1 Tax=Pontibacter ummariensis TaxID=1610492 RepID=A0A239J233_9BACT|nr:response regulator [Pontibacter ummariensis]PRY08847.1 signal transduction histidine kinase [Pontibacter ummariensis]SNS99981.1 Signal transduction histidine kinase [Pontibacter ummariensis]
MNIIKNLKIRDKLLLLLFLLLFPLIYFVAVTVKRELDENSSLKQETVQLTESEKLSELLHAFQRERALILAASGGESGFLLDAKAQRGKTDAAARELTEFLVSEGRTFPDLALLNELERYRNALDKNELDVPAFREYSTGLIFNFLNKVDANATGISNVEIGRQLISFRNLAEAKVQLGRIRSLLMIFPEGALSTEDYARISSHIDFYKRALNDFSRHANGEAVGQVQEIVASDDYKEVAAILQAIERSPDLNLSALDPTKTFNAFTTNIEDFRDAENLLIDDIREEVYTASSQKQQYVAFLILGVVLLLGLAIVLCFYIINSISRPLSTLKRAADRIKLGATDVVININSRDEIGSVADSFRGVVEKNILLSQVAQAIGHGRYDVEVAVQSKEDLLSYAIKDMKDNLQTFTEENANRNWILTGVSEFNNELSGETGLNGIADKAIAFLCDYTSSEAGILYLYNDSGELEPRASYGVPYSREQLPSFAVGTGKLGQAVSERKVKVLEGVADEYLKITTGLSDIAPASIIIIPLYFSNNVVGALELCARKPYNELQQKFLGTVSERLSVIVHTQKTHLQTQELLYETQNQAEELETQQEELRQLNAELKASEEELRVSQEELQEKNAELEEKAQLLEEQYEALNTKNKALEGAREAIELKMQQVETVSKYKSDFLANMSHELRTPLNSILILSRLLADNVENTLSTKQIDHAQIIHKSGNDLLKLINEILDLSKIESGMIKVEAEEVNLKELSLEPMFREVASKKQIHYRETFTPGSFDTIVTDRFRLEQILKNFIGNAIKFTNKGGEVELSVYPVQEKPDFRSEQLREEQDIVAFSVRDTGIGIPKEQQQLVFEAFQQADTSTTRKYGGTGLGLTISKELATLLGGELMLESEPGKGSTFTLYLPRVPQREETKHTAPAKQETAAPPVSKAESVFQSFEKLEPKDKKEISVLIVEDDKGFSDILADFAAAKNFKIHQAYTGAEGLRLAREEKPDAMLLDIHLPDTNGWDILKQIREDKELRHTNVHVMSAYDKEVIGEFADNEEYLPKPVTLEMLNRAFTTISSSSASSIEKILIVEDNEVENKAVAELLLAHGLKSTSAFSAEEAERILAKQKVDCIILDLNLPGMKGYEWMRTIKSQHGLADIPIIIYSGKDLSEEEETALKEFANTIIIKNEYSYLRLLDEVQLFLHKVNQKLPTGNEFKMKLHVPEEVLQAKKVLVVDDDVRNIYSLSSLLELHGMKVVAAYNGKEALEKLEKEAGIDMVLMDVMMPEMDGIEATKRIRENTRFKQLPIIALTAKAMKEDKEKCLRAGASDYIPKPVDTEKLLTLMRVWLYEV